MGRPPWAQSAAGYAQPLSVPARRDMRRSRRRSVLLHMSRPMTKQMWCHVAAPSLPVYLGDNQIQAAHQGKGVGQQHAPTGLAKETQIGKGWGTEFQPVGNVATIADR